MATLVPIPWQPGYYLTPDTLSLLIAAGNKLQTQFQVADAWRSYAEQAYYYDQYKNHGGNIASSPDSGQRNHMRGAAFDLARTDASAQAACHSVGLLRDPDESWHWNNPYWANMPIIPTNPNTSTAGDGGSTPIQKEFVMKYQLIQASGNATIYLTGPGITFAIPNGTWYNVLSRWADAMNNNKSILLTKGEWDIVAAATRGGK